MNEKLRLIENYFERCCADRACTWYDLYDSSDFKYVEDYAESLNLTAWERHLYEDWKAEMTAEL